MASSAASGNVTPAPVAPEPPAANGLPAITITDQFGGFSFAYTDIISSKYLVLFKGKDEIRVGELPALLPCEERSVGGTTQTAVSISGREYCVKIERGAVKSANQSIEYTYTTSFTGGPPAVKAAVKAVEIQFGTNGLNCEAAFADDAVRLAECENANSSKVMSKFADQIFKSIIFVK